VEDDTSDANRSVDVVTTPILPFSPSHRFIFLYTFSDLQEIYKLLLSSRFFIGYESSSKVQGSDWRESISGIGEMACTD
jgi:hypothetical protein